MPLDFERIEYADLNSRQRENYNFHKLAAVLADYGFTAIRLSDDWEGADFLAAHVDGETLLRVQLKGRLSFYEKYVGKGLHVGFPSGNDWYLYPHDDVLATVLDATTIGETASWQKHGGYSFPGLSAQMRDLLEPYRLHQATSASPAGS